MPRFLAPVASASLLTYGGSTHLTSTNVEAALDEVDTYVGATFLPLTGGAISGSFLSVGTNPAATGVLRLNNNASIVWRNNANSADIVGMRVSLVDALVLGNGTVGVVATGPYLSVGSTPATTGAVRLPNNVGMYWRNAANNADNGSVTYSSGNVLTLDGVSGTTITVGGSNTIAATAGAVSIDADVTLAGGRTLTTNSTVTINVGGVVIGNAVNIALATSTGTKIGTGATQKLAFWNATPIVQPTSTTDLRTVLINTGLLATGGASPLNLNGGTLTAGLILGPIAFSAKTTTYTLTATDGAVTADATSAAFTVTLPTAVGDAGRVFHIKRINSGTNAVTVGTTSSQTIDGVTTFALNVQWQSVTVVSDGTNWLVI